MCYFAEYNSSEISTCITLDHRIENKQAIYSFLVLPLGEITMYIRQFRLTSDYDARIVHKIVSQIKDDEQVQPMREKSLFYSTRLNAVVLVPAMWLIACDVVELAVIIA